jgi:hypothetical protein
MAGGIGKMRGGKHRQHLALPSQLKEADRRKRICFTLSRTPLQNRPLTRGMPVQRGSGYDSPSLAGALMA